MGKKNPKSVHHRGASGIHDDSWGALGTDKSDGIHQNEYAHVLYGALEGGPNKDGSFNDKVGAYEKNFIISIITMFSNSFSRMWKRRRFKNRCC